MDLDALRREALSLPVAKRAELASDLLSSLDAMSPEELDQLWLDEAARRAEEIDRGQAKRISADEARRQAQSLLNGAIPHRSGSRHPARAGSRVPDQRLVPGRRA